MKDMDVDTFVKEINLLDPYKKNWNVRLIRHYTNEGFIDTPKRIGRKVFYNNKHLEQVLKVSQMKEDGINLSKIKYNIDESQDVENLRKSALESLASQNYIKSSQSNEEEFSSNRTPLKTSKKSYHSPSVSSCSTLSQDYQKLVLEDGLEIQFNKIKLDKVMLLIKYYNKMEEENE